MLYFRVKEEFDQCTRYTTTGKQSGVLIGGELYTAKERAKLRHDDYVFEEVNMSKNDTHSCFGVRLSNDDEREIASPDCMWC